MSKYLILAVCVLIITGCASDIMQSYIGKDLREPILDYGQPANAFDMGDGTRAFQWIMRESHTAPTVINSAGNVYGSGNAAWFNSNTVITGGNNVTSECLYTLLAKFNKNKKAWIVTGFRKPRLSCE